MQPSRLQESFRHDFIQQYVKTSLVFRDENHHNGNVCDKHIVFGVDASFLRHACISMLSIIQQNNDEPFHFHLITDCDISSFQPHFQSLINGNQHQLTVHQVSPDLFSHFPTTSLFTRATYYRLIAPYIIFSASFLLYLDADIVCLNPCAQLWQQAKENNAVAFAVLEQAPLRTELAKAVALPDDYYFNAGMLLINTRLWRENAISTQVFNVLTSYGNRLLYLDQDALNIVLHGRYQIIASRYNTLFKLGHSQQDYRKMPKDDTIFLHYAGADKPWQQWNKQAVCRFYQSLYQQSSWSSFPWDKPTNNGQAKKMYKQMLREKKFFSAFRWYITYYRMRYGR